MSRGREDFTGGFPIGMMATQWDDGTWFVQIPSMPGVCFHADTLKVAEEQCIEQALSLIDNWKNWKLRQDAAAINTVFTEALKNEPIS